MIEIKTKKVQYLNPEDEGHVAFATWVSAFSRDELQAMFADPADYGEEEKIDHLPTEEMKRGFIAHRETYARSVKAEDGYELLSAKLVSLKGFEALKTPILNAEMKPIVKAALMMEIERTDDIEVMSNVMDLLEIINPNYYSELAASQKTKGTDKATQKKNVMLADTDSTQRVQQPNPASYFKPLPPKPVAPAVAKPKPTPVSVFDCLQADSGEVLKKTSPHGFDVIEFKTDSMTLGNINGKVENKPAAMRLKDSNGHYVDFFKDGSAKTSEYDVTDNVEAVSNDMLKALLTMLNVYVVLCDQKGLEAVLPNGELLNPQFSVAKSTDNSEKIRDLIVEKLKQTLLHSQYDIIRERVCFDGKKLFPGLPPKEKQEMHEPCSIRFFR